MSCRSSVAIVTDPAVEWPEEVKGELEKIAPIQEDGSRKLWAHTSIKWYDDYFPATLAWLKALALDDESDEGFGFIRLGEGNYDVEYEGCPSDFGVDWSRRIDTD